MNSNINPHPALDFTRPLVTVDVVIFTVQDEALKVLLVRRPDGPSEPFPGRWALPGGFVDLAKDVSLVDCAARKLREKTGISTPYLEQLGSWGDRTRDPRGWSVTNVFFALVPLAKPVDIDASSDLTSLQWVNVEAAQRKRLAFDHLRILTSAVARLRGKVEYTSLPSFLLAEPFTLPQLQQTYEVVLGRSVDKSGFRRRMLDAKFLVEAGMMDSPGGRAAMGYRLVDRSLPITFPRTFRSGE